MIIINFVKLGSALVSRSQTQPFATRWAMGSRGLGLCFHFKISFFLHIHYYVLGSQANSKQIMMHNDIIINHHEGSSSSDSDIENVYGKCSKLKGRCLADITNKRNEKIQPLTWNELPENLQNVLPDIHNFTLI